MIVNHFLADALINKHVGVHGHGHAKGNSRETWQGECGIHECHHAKDNGGIDNQRQVGDEASHKVIQQHGHGGHANGKHDSRQAAIKIVRADGWAKHIHADGLRTQLPFKRAGGKNTDEIFNFLLVKAAGDLTASTNAALQIWRGVDLAVKHNGHGAANVWTSEPAHFLTTCCVKTKRNAGSTKFVDAARGALQTP